MTEPDRRAEQQAPTGATARRRLIIAVGAGMIAAGISAALAPSQAVPLFGWFAAALTWIAWSWLVVLRLDASDTARFATREEPHRKAVDLILITAAVASLVAVVLGVIKASSATGAEQFVLLAAGVASIVSSWGVVHTVFTLRYAALYYEAGGGVDFNDQDDPTYGDFAYLAFTIGMTYQVSDTDLTSRAVRHTALRHALLSFLFGTVIIAATINIAAGLA